jgi:hypothetical protein
MKFRSIVPVFAVLLLVCAGLPLAASADSSHVRIIRLSLVQGDVRYTSSFHDDPLTDAKAVWETAALNMPIREGYALSTGSGRAEVEFENGAMAFLSANTVIDFYDLSLHDGNRVTRLVLRQGSAIFYVHSQNGDYYSVTGGDFSVDAGLRSRFRLDNFDDGSTVNVEGGQVSVIRNDKSTPLEKGQSLSVRASDLGNQVITRASSSDDFDRWVSGRIDSVVTATNYSNQYVSTANYSSGFADLYTYGSWFSVGGYGNCWRPFGVAMGWSPFGSPFGNWFFDASMGWSFVGSAPWGWLPYHYGGWIFSPMYGWVWAPQGFGYGNPVVYRPVTAVWVHSGNTLGVVPVHPGDKNGKTPLNLAQGIYPVQGRGIAQPVAVASGEKWSVVKHAPVDALIAGNTAATSSPTHVSRALPASNLNTRQATLDRQSSIVYDTNEHRFVNSNQTPVVANVPGQPHVNTTAVNEANAGHSGVSNAHPATVSAIPRSTVPPRPVMTPAPAHVGGGSSGSSSGSTWIGGRGSGTSSGSPHPSSSTSSSHPSSSGGGGRPH